MAITVVKKEPHPSVVKEIICKNCGCTLQYTPNDELRDYHSDYTGGRDYYSYIDCPECANRVITKGY